MNPFTLKFHPDYFCDRVQETQQFKDNLSNGLNTLLHSPRRLGKSALIHNLFYQLEQEGKFETLYIDLFATQNMQDLIRTFAEKILEKYYIKNILTGIKKILSGISPTLTFSHDGTPQLKLSLSEHQIDNSLKQLFNYLDNRNKPIVAAFDEFQEVATYPEKAEALLRTYIQELKNVYFIFSGSSNHLLQNMFYSATRPFYQSSEALILEKISRDQYSLFIESLFNLNSKKIEKDAIEYILDFTETYTYYTQVICNQAFFRSEKKLTIDETIEITDNYIENRKLDYLSIFNLLPGNQKKIVIAIAKEKAILKPTSVEFLMKYQLPSASSTLQAVNALILKEILYKNPDGYSIYDIFFERFLEKYY